MTYSCCFKSICNPVTCFGPWNVGRRNFCHFQAVASMPLSRYFILTLAMMYAKSHWSPMGFSPPGSSVHEVLQARMLAWIVMAFSRGSSQPRDWTRISYISWIGRQVLYHWRHLEALGNTRHLSKDDSLLSPALPVCPRVQCHRILETHCYHLIFKLGFHIRLCGRCLFPMN